MRDIKFRGKTSVSNEFAYGDYHYDRWDNKHFIIAETGDHYERYRVDPETVGQYTGLRDENCVEIYEGDIVELGVVRYQIKFMSGSFVFCLDDTDYYHLNDFEKIKDWDDLPFEIIGNIYDNPELLESE